MSFTSSGDVCRNCGKAASEHIAANFSQGPFVSMVVLICPNNVFQIQKESNECQVDK